MYVGGNWSLVFTTFFFWVGKSYDASFIPRSGKLQTQKLKSHLVRTQSLNALPLKPGVGQNVALHATLTARISSLLISTLPVHSPAFFQNLSRFFHVLAVANTGFCVGRQKRIGHLLDAGSRVECPRNIHKL